MNGIINQGNGEYQFTGGERNSWKLCKAHCGCRKWQKTLASYRRKANKHSYNASRLKYALMCFLEGDATQHYNGGILADEYGGVENIPKPIPVPIDDDPVFTMTEDLSVDAQKKENELYTCGVCQEKMVKEGKKKPIIYQCGHSNCAECFNQMLAHDLCDCPYCKTQITKAIRLFTCV